MFLASLQLILIKCSSYVLVVANGHVVVCPVEVKGKDNTQVLVFRELFSINCIGCSIEIKRWLSPKRTWTNLVSLNNKSDERLHTTALLTSLWSLLTSFVDLINNTHLVSSANTKGMVEWTCSGRSLIKITNKIGPSTLP